MGEDPDEIVSLFGDCVTEKFPIIHVFGGFHHVCFAYFETLGLCIEVCLPQVLNVIVHCPHSQSVLVLRVPNLHQMVR